MATDTSERGLESLIVAAMTGRSGGVAGNTVGEIRPGLGTGYVEGSPAEYDRDYAVDLGRLLQFLNATQPAVVEQFALEADGPKRRQFLNRLQGEIAKRGVIDVLRKGIKHGGPRHPLLRQPTPGNQKAARLYQENIFSVTRQLQYSKDARPLALDLCLFINGLPVFTFELKNSLTKQTVEDAVQQYRATATRASCFSSSAAAWPILPSTTRKCASAPS
jgi:type I restriction enzyme, R subunit